VVYLDADTFVCTNIDNLFSEPHMSAVNSGGMLPELSDWVDLNSGVLVIEPNKSLFEDFMQKMEYLPSKGGGDQGFLQSYYPNWPEQEELHLCHGYNMFVGHVRFYKKLFGYRFANQIKEFDEKVIRILHFWADFKPWVFENFSGIQGDERIVCNLWFKTANQMMEKLSLKTSKKLGKHFPNLSRIKEILHESNGV
jgi:lipopolysaccharide biosynthesis glycosyltransferase